MPIFGYLEPLHESETTLAVIINRMALREVINWADVGFSPLKNFQG